MLIREDSAAILKTMCILSRQKSKQSPEEDVGHAELFIWKERVGETEETRMKNGDSKGC